MISGSHIPSRVSECSIGAYVWASNSFILGSVSRIIFLALIFVSKNIVPIKNRSFKELTLEESFFFTPIKFKIIIELETGLLKLSSLT